MAYATGRTLTPPQCVAHPPQSGPASSERHQDYRRIEDSSRKQYHGLYFATRNTILLEHHEKEQRCPSNSSLGRQCHLYLLLAVASTVFLITLGAGLWWKDYS